MHTIGDYAQHDEDLQQIQEERDDAGIDQISEHGTDGYTQLTCQCFAKLRFLLS